MERDQRREGGRGNADQQQRHRRGQHFHGDRKLPVFFTPGAGTQSATGFITNGSLRITPTATGGTLAMGANNLDTVALMLNGDKDFAISGSGVLAGGVTPRYIHVNDANTTLTTSLVIVSSSTGATNIVGPGFVVLNSGTSQNTATNARINLLGGTLRANNTQIGFSNTGGGSLVFAGGVLEIQGGGTITRTLNAFGGQGTVHWEGGSGGFSAFGERNGQYRRCQCADDVGQWRVRPGRLCPEIRLHKIERHCDVAEPRSSSMAGRPGTISYARSTSPRASATWPTIPSFAARSRARRVPTYSRPGPAFSH